MSKRQRPRTHLWELRGISHLFRAFALWYWHCQVGLSLQQQQQQHDYFWTRYHQPSDTYFAPLYFCRTSLKAELFSMTLTQHVHCSCAIWMGRQKFSYWTYGTKMLKSYKMLMVKMACSCVLLWYRAYIEDVECSVSWFCVSRFLLPFNDAHVCSLSQCSSKKLLLFI